LTLVNVRAFGAKGDGATDDTTAITNAINALVTTGASRGGVVFFPPGVYNIASLTLTNSWITFQGSGRTDDNTGAGALLGTTTLTCSGCLIRTNVVQGVLIRGTPNTVQFTNNTVIESNQGPGVALTQLTNVLMSHLIFRDTYIASNNIATGTYQFQTNTNALGTNIRQLLLDGVYFSSPGAHNPGDIDLDGVLWATIRNVTGSA